MIKTKATFTDEELILHRKNIVKFIAIFLSPTILLVLFFSITLATKIEYRERLVAFKTTIETFVRRQILPHPVETLNINVKLDRWNTIKKAREQTKDIGVVGPGMNPLYDEEHKATIDWRGDEYKVKIRLKGFGRDHRRDSKKWSLSIEMRKDDTLMGMKKFAIHHPETRSWQSECVFQNTLRSHGLVSVDCMVVNVLVNGEKIGIMTLTQKTDKSILELQQKKQGLIIRPNVDWMVEENEHGKLRRCKNFKELPNQDSAKISPAIRNHYLNVIGRPLKLYNEKAIKKNEGLMSQAAIAASLWEGLIDGYIKPSEAFDLTRSPRALAISLVLSNGHLHAYQSHNFKLYYNPSILMFEVLPTDLQSFGNFRDTVEPMTQNSLNFLPNLLLSDPFFSAQIIKELDKMDAEVSAGRHPLGAQFQIREEEILSGFENEYSKRPKWKTASIISRIGQVREQISNQNIFSDYTLPKTSVDFPEDYNLNEVVSARYYNYESNPMLRIINLYQTTFSIKNLKVRFKDKNNNIIQETIKIDTPLNSTFGMGHANGLRMAGEALIPLSFVDHADDIVDLSVTLFNKNQNKLYVTEAVKHYPAFRAHPLAPMTIDSLKQTMTFIEVDNLKTTITIPSGNWRVNDFVVMPKGYKLVILPGTKIQFGKDAGILLYGPLQAVGNKANKISLTSIDEQGWRGVTVLQSNFWSPSESSILEFVHLKDLREHGVGQWQLTGAINFVESDVTFKDVLIEDVLAEDALNVVQSQFEFNRLSINKTYSDAFDSDFSEGKIIESDFINIGGDGVDLSGSDVFVTNSKFYNIHDKAISVGEASKLNATEVNISETGTGVASKDGSVSYIQKISFSKIKYFPLMVYMKKPIYGPASLKAYNVKFQGRTEKFGVAQKRNTLEINGNIIAPTFLNVDVLYEGYMKK